MAPTIMAARLAVAATLAASSVSNQYTILAGGFAGQVSTLHFNATAGSLTVTGGSDKAGLSPGYVCLHPEKNILLATDEDKGTISAFNVSSTGALDFLEQHDAGGLGTVACDVNVVHMQIAVANYFDGSFASWIMQDDGTPQVKPRHFEKFSMAAPGPVSDRQDHPYAHQAKYDPSGAFLFIPDLGADLVRLYSVAGSEPVHATDIQLPAGSGPRHVDFVQAPGAAPHDPATHAYVICELSNTVEVFALTYSSDLISLTTAHVQSVPTAIDGPPAGLTGAASELAILRQQNVLVAGNRWKDNGEVPAVQTDHAAFYTICANGTLTPLRMEDLAVRNARMFEADPTGTMLAVAGQESGEVVVFQIDGWKELARTALKQVGAVRWFAPRA